MKFSTRYGEFETENVVKDYVDDWLPVKAMREAAITEDGREGFIDIPTQTLYLFKRGRRR